MISNEEDFLRLVDNPLLPFTKDLNLERNFFSQYDVILKLMEMTCFGIFYK